MQPAVLFVTWPSITHILRNVLPSLICSLLYLRRIAHYENLALHAKCAMIQNVIMSHHIALIFFSYPVFKVYGFSKVMSHELKYPYLK